MKLNDFDINLAKFTAISVLSILALMALYAASVNKELAARHRLLIAEQNRCMANTESHCYIKVVSSKQLMVLNKHKKEQITRYGVEK